MEAKEERASDAGEPISLTRHGAAGVAVLDRPERRNALSRDMQGALAGWYPRLARDPGVYAAILRSALPGVFSVGGDVRELLQMADADLRSARQALAAEIRLFWLHECFSKPTIALIDGTVMGSGAGISLYGTHRVGGERYRFSMPETAIGYFPDCGLAHAFARMPDAIGLYLGLTGAEVGPADGLALGLLTHCIPAAEFATIEALIADAEPVDPVLDDRHREPAIGPLITSRERIARYFDTGSLADVFLRLEKPRAEDRDWAAVTLAGLLMRSPLALHLTFQMIEMAGRLDIRETLIQDFRLGWRMVADPDFKEGVSAMLMDKGRPPRWRHAHVGDVPEDLVKDCFAPLGEDDLALPSRIEMQAARV